MAPQPSNPKSNATFLSGGVIALGGLGLCLCLVAAAIAGGVLYFRRGPASAPVPSVAYILDTSPRMANPAAGAAGQTRLTVAQGVLAEIIRADNPELVTGLSVFGSGANANACQDANVLVPFAAANHTKIATRLSTLTAGSAADAALAQAMLLSMQGLAQYQGRRSLVVVTGGADSCNADANQLIAQEAARAGIDLQVFVIGFQVTEADAAAIKGMVAGTATAHFLPVPDAAALQRILQNIQATYAQAGAGFPLTTLLDTFDRGDGPAGSNWGSDTGSYTVTGQALAAPAEGRLMWTAQAFGATQEAYVTLAAIDQASEIDLVLKEQDPTDYKPGAIKVGYLPPSHQAQVWTYDPAGGWVQQGADIPVTFADGDQFGARARADGSVEVYRNGALLDTRSVSSWPFAAQGGWIGLVLVQAGSARLDLFGGGTPSGPEPTLVPTATPAPTDTPTATATPTPPDLAGPPTAATGGTAAPPGQGLGSVYLVISAVGAGGQTVFTVHFTDKVLEAQRNKLQFTWNLAVPPGDACGLAATGFRVEPDRPWIASWRHPNCTHSPGETVTVTVTQGDRQVTLTGPALAEVEQIVKP